MKIFKEITGQGKDVVLLHGWGGCNHKHMQPIVDQLASRYRITNFDLPGLGESEWSPDIQNINDIGDQLLPYLPKQAICIGWSFGGLVGMSIAARYPELIERFIGIATSPKFVADEHWSGIPHPGFQSSFTAGIQKLGLKSFIESWYDSEFSSFNPKPLAYHELIKILAQDFSKIDLDILFKGINICDSSDLRNELKSINCAVDLILSEQDDCIPASAFEKIKALSSNINIHLISDAHHMPFWTHPNKFNKILNHLL